MASEYHGIALLKPDAASILERVGKACICFSDLNLSKLSEKVYNVARSSSFQGNVKNFYPCLSCYYFATAVLVITMWLGIELG